MLEAFAFIAAACATVAVWLAVELRQTPQERVSDAARVMSRRRADKAKSARRAAIVAHIDSFGSYASPRVDRLRAMVDAGA